jgi:DNA-binding transcriptional MocR family regulator
MLNLDRENPVPLFRQLLVQLKEKIDTNVLKAGDALPPTRTLADQLGINRTTIYKAYQELWALGYIESRSGSYSYVRQRRDVKLPESGTHQPVIPWPKRVNRNAEKIYHIFKDICYPFSESTPNFTGIDFGNLHPDSRLFPVSAFRKSLRKVLLADSNIVLDYGESRGLASLREYISGRMCSHSIATSTDEILITNGAQNALDLLIKLLATPGARVFIEAPTYGMIVPTLTFYNCEIIQIPMKEDGADISAIKQEFKKGLPAFFYTMPNFHNPTGITTTQEHREKLIALFEKHGIPIVEDAFEEEMKYFGKVPLPIKSMDVKQVVIYIGSFSKILFPGIRLGWVAADKECIDRLTVLKRFSDISTALPEQAALADFCHNGNYELHIKRIHKIYRKRMLLTMQQLRLQIRNKHVSWIEPNGGFTIWLSMEKTKCSYEEINKIFLLYKIRLALGKDFFPGWDNRKYFRLSIASLNESEITEGIGRLAQAVTAIYEKKLQTNKDMI